MKYDGGSKSNKNITIGGIPGYLAVMGRALQCCDEGKQMSSDNDPIYCVDKHYPEDTLNSLAFVVVVSSVRNQLTYLIVLRI